MSYGYLPEWYEESIFMPEIQRKTLWKCPNCMNEVLVQEVGLVACPICLFNPTRWHSNLESPPSGG